MRRAKGTPGSATAADSPEGPTTSVRDALLEAAALCLREYGYTKLSTRRVAQAARVPLSQIHYHFGSKEALVLALLDRQNRRLLHRQETMFASDIPLWKRWEQACDYLDDDIASGYVRVLQEMIAVGWSNPEVAAAVRECLRGWYRLLAAISDEAAQRFGSLGELEPYDLAALVGNAFLGSEAMLLLGFEQEGMPVRRALRRIGPMIRRLEQQSVSPKRSAKRRRS